MENLTVGFVRPEPEDKEGDPADAEVEVCSWICYANN